jgi:hypothetical protein
VVGVFLVVMPIVWQPQITVLVAIYAYALSAPVTWLWKIAMRKDRGLARPVVGTLPEQPRTM